jgi:hypothetical protein
MSCTRPNALTVPALLNAPCSAPYSRLKDDCGAARAGAVEVQAVSADVDQSTRHGVGAGVHRLTHGLEPPATEARASTASTG